QTRVASSYHLTSDNQEGNQVILKNTKEYPFDRYYKTCKSCIPVSSNIYQSR
ncbi:hypothetical protein MKX01_035081, partial [Papaver californicum]